MSWTFRQCFRRVHRFKCEINGAPCYIEVDFNDRIIEIHAESLFFEKPKHLVKDSLFINEDFDEDDSE